MELLIKRIQENLRDDLLNPKYKKLRTKKSHKFFGHCYVATEAFYHFYGKKHGYKPQVIRIGDKTHWYLRKGNEIVDITKEQFNFQINYDLGRGCGFLTKKPSKRTQWLIDNINGRY
jgi:hypothetical protein